MATDPRDDDATIDPTTGPMRSVPPSVPRSATPSAERFAPGAIVAGRYRLVALLKRGGMGEVYRADDLTLAQPVALKFLAEGVAADADRLAQFHNELRVARQVSHKNVCRLYDLGDADGRRFLTMEYIDGEDLAALLRRIGRFAGDRALALARQLCAGVAAAHERGVIHRDLKPANVMIDGDGNVRITDFGIATAAGGGSGLAGTPQYMAPEQFTGASASVRTDLYALGLILFEIFTGKRVHDAKSIADLRALHDTGSVTTPSSIVRDLDPAVERVILRCLDKDPQARPASALAVAAALPGGDPLAEALAAGETPSPEVLAAAGETDALRVDRGLAAVAATVVGLFVLAIIAPKITIVGRSPTAKPPAVLADRVQQILASLGYTEPAADTTFGLARHQALLRWIETTDQSPRRWDRLNAGSPSALIFWHRTSPRLLVPLGMQLQPTLNDPPLTVSGMTLVIVDSIGRLLEFQAVPPQVEARSETPPPVRWEPLFEAAGLNMAAFTPVPPQWSPRDFADTRAAWEGRLADHPDYHVRVEAAAFRGRPVSMFLLGPWSQPTRMALLTRSTTRVVLSALVSMVIAVLVVVALLVARHNWRAGRADTRAASRLVALIMAGYAASWTLGAHHVPDVALEIDSFLRFFGGALMWLAMLWVVYLALEPYVRRFWPDGILGWTRLTSGYVRDPRVGRDVLVAVVITVWVAVLQALFDLVPPLLGYRTSLPLFQSNVNALIGIPTALSLLFDQVVNSVFVAMLAVLAYVLLRLVFRRTTFAIAAAMVLLAIVQAPQALAGDPWWIAAAFQAILVVVLTTVVVRFGLLVTAVTLTIGNVLYACPFTYHLSHWTATASNLAIAVTLAFGAFGFYASRSGQPLFGRLAIDTPRG